MMGTPWGPLPPSTHCRVGTIRLRWDRINEIERQRQRERARACMRLVVIDDNDNDNNDKARE
jgi:hypothetical protein